MSDPEPTTTKPPRPTLEHVLGALNEFETSAAEAARYEWEEKMLLHRYAGFRYGKVAAQALRREKRETLVKLIVRLR